MRSTWWAMATERIVIVAGPRCGKSWMALELGGADPLMARANAYKGTLPIYCGDPLSKVKDPVRGVNYLPEELPFAGDYGAAQWVVDRWFAMPGPWICEGHVMARALRRWVSKEERIWSDSEGPPMSHFPRIIVLENQRDDCDVSPGQRAMHKGVMRVWASIANEFPEEMVEYR